MTLDEMISDCLKVAENQCKVDAEFWDHRQLTEWLTELKELRELTIINPIIAGYNEIYEELRKGDIEASNDKDLLKTAIDTLENVMPKYRRLSEENLKQKEQIAEYKRLLKAALADMNNGGCNSNCYKCKHCGACDYSERFTWKLTDEALKLIGGSENG